jgi:hypothetical protein
MFLIFMAEAYKIHWEDSLKTKNKEFIWGGSFSNSFQSLWRLLHVIAVLKDGIYSVRAWEACVGASFTRSDGIFLLYIYYIIFSFPIASKED